MPAVAPGRMTNGHLMHLAFDAVAAQLPLLGAFRTVTAARCLMIAVGRLDDLVAHISSICIYK